MDFGNPMQWLVYGVISLAAACHILTTMLPERDGMTPEMRLLDAMAMNTTMCVVIGVKWAVEYLWSGLDQMPILTSSMTFGTVAFIEFLLLRILKSPPVRW